MNSWFVAEKAHMKDFNKLSALLKKMNGQRDDNDEAGGELAEVLEDQGGQAEPKRRRISRVFKGSPA